MTLAGQDRPVNEKGNSMTNVTRRSFVSSAAAAAGVAGIAGIAAQAQAAESTVPQEWEAEADIVIVGCGGAGISAALTAADEGLGSTLLLEAAPKGYEGGNTRVSAQVIFCPDSVEGAIKYQTNLNGGHVVAPELIQAWAENITQNIDWLASQGIEAAETSFFNPEWPDVDGSEHCHCYLVGDGRMGYEQLWNALADRAEELGVEITNNVRVTELVWNAAGEVIGVRDEEGKAYKAKKGVLLACGGFENDPEMIADFFQIGYYETKPMGTPYNRGDGIRLAMSAGAQLWHMNNFANSGYGTLSAGEDGGVVIVGWPFKDYIYVGPDGTRFMYEECISLARHGKYLTSGSATNLAQPCPTYAIFGSKTFEGDTCVFMQNYLCQWNILMEETLCETNEEYLEEGLMFKGDTPEELAEQIGIDPAVLAATINHYNENAAQGVDPDFNRGTDVYSAFNYGAQGDSAMAGATDDGLDEKTPSIAAFELEQLEAPYYAVRLYTATLNTQGGPKRGADGSVLRPGDVAVPRLYAAGELGTIYSYNYNGGGNVSEAMSSGRLAARSIAALEAWE